MRKESGAVGRGRREGRGGIGKVNEEEVEYIFGIEESGECKIFIKLGAKEI